MSNLSILKRAFYTTDIREFMSLIFPKEWDSVAARIIESGVSMSGYRHTFAPRWNKIPATIRAGNTELDTQIKSCIFRAHDLIHQLWGLPIPGKRFTVEDFYNYKRAQMCGEVVVLMFTEFYLVPYLSSCFPELSDTLYQRNAIPMLKGPLLGKSHTQIVTRLDNILHQHKRPKWVRDNVYATAFADDYVPMLEKDREMVDHNWNLMKESNWVPHGVPNSRYSSNLDGMELTLWMVEDFLHLIDTDPVVDEDLAKFNWERRLGIQLPKGWDGV